MGKDYYHWQLEEYAARDRLPIYIESVPKGKHPERYFHDHNCSEIVFVISGTATHLVKTSNIEPNKRSSNKGLLTAQIQTGDILILHPSFIHAYDKTETLEILNIVYDMRQLTIPLLDGYMLPLFHKFFPALTMDKKYNLAEPVISLSPEEMQKILSIVQRLKETIDLLRPGGLFECLILFMEVIISISRLREGNVKQEKRIPFLIGKAVSFIKSNFAREITLDQIAHACNMSRRNFCRHFRSMVGTSPTSYLLQVRIDQAAELLALTDLNISEIGLNCGFSDSNYFSRRFKENKGVTPRVFRQDNRWRDI